MKKREIKLNYLEQNHISKITTTNNLNKKFSKSLINIENTQSK